eukprot:TRINITY_DN5697_c0_g1_i2.p1 TRINITY_DN5697_c0_g1~~TRINITY_DN5697_c0_g1_i2.p1  ORF type:complete len:535 (-),score=209.98 TRINITY_DN5697_c0_g1_i2:165-1769(-)
MLILSETHQTGQELTISQLRIAAEQNFHEWAQLSDRLRGYEPNGPFAHCVGSTAYFVGQYGNVLNGLITSFGELARTASLPAPRSVRTVEGQQVATVFPNGFLDKVMYPDFVGEIWLEPGAQLQQSAPQQQAAGVALVLGAGNYEAMLEVLQKAFIDNKVVVFKPNPVNDLSAVAGKVFAPLIRRGYLAVLSGGADVGAALVNHESVDELIMTGGCATYDRIVWGPPDQQAANKQNGSKQLTKHFEAELGAVSPYIVVPGKWTSAELEHHAAQVAGGKLDNGGHFCASPQLLVTDRSWPQRDEFLQRVRAQIRTALPRPSYYPGARQRHDTLKAAYPDAEVLSPAGGLPSESVLPVLFVPNAQPESVLVKEEAFCPAMAEMPLDTNNDPASFLTAAVEFVNERVFGSLSGTILIDPRTEKLHKAALENAISRMKYGAIGVNVWGGFVCGVAPLIWGAYPGHADHDIQSGIGKINNTLMFDRAAKSVLRSPFVSPAHTKPLDANMSKVMSRLAWFNLRPGIRRLVPVAGAMYIGI